MATVVVLPYVSTAQYAAWDSMMPNV